LKFGIALPNSGPVATPQAIRLTAEKAEQLGLHIVWVHDHISYGKEWLGHRASGVSEQISDETKPDFYETLTTLSFIAGFTERIQLGTGVLVVPLRNPLVLGRQLLTLQKLSKGRLILGTGIGDYPAEFKVLNVPYDQRTHIFEEYLHALRLILQGGSVTYHGKIIKFDNAQFYPRVNPPPILIGGGVIAVPEPGEDKLSLPVLKRVARLGDGWMPDWGTPEIVAEGVKKIKKLAKEFKRNVDFHISFSTGFHLAATDEEAKRRTSHSINFAEKEANLVARFGTRTPEKIMQRNFIGSADTIIKRVEKYQNAGVNYLKLMTLTPSVESLLGMMEKFSREVMPSF